MAYKIRIRGEREPVVINNDTYGSQLESDWLSGKLKGNRIKVGDGHYEGDDIRSVVRLFSEEEQSNDPYDRVYSDQELDTFGDEIKPYCLEANTPEYLEKVTMIEQMLLSEDDPFVAEITKHYILEGRKQMDESKTNLTTIAQRIATQRFVGKLTKQGWEQYLEKNMVIVVSKDDKYKGRWMVVTDAGGAKLPRYDALKSAWERREHKREYAEFQKLTQLEGLE